jgi:hypothetical protein
MNANLDFLSRRSDIGIATPDLVHAAFKMTREAPILTNDMRLVLTIYAQLQAIFPASISISLGRSLYAKSDPSSDWAAAGLPAIKAKGIAGLSEARGGMGYMELPGAFAIVDELKYVLAPPMPKKPFIMSDRVHIAFRDNLRLTAKISAPKFWFSLPREGAEREFDSQELLAKHNLGFGAVCAGGFYKAKSEPEVDGISRPTGGVFLAHDPTAQTVSRFANFSTFRTASGELNVFPPSSYIRGKNEIQTGYDFQSLVENFISFSAKIADVKAKAILQAGVARHSSHDGNFWYAQSKDLVQMSDNDTCLLLKDQPEETHGTILLRDYSTFLNRIVRQLSLNAFDAAYFSLLEEGQCRPVHRVLEQLFKGLATPEAIEETGTAITKAYLSFVLGDSRAGGAHTEELFAAAGKVMRGLSGADEKAGNSYLSDEGKMLWEIAHVNFYEVVIPELYKLCKKSRLAELGFTLPDLDIEAWTINLKHDLQEVIKSYREEFAKDMRRNRGEVD